MSNLHYVPNTKRKMENLNTWRFSINSSIDIHPADGRSVTANGILC